MRFKAQQTISLREPCFVWRASTGPLGSVTVIDALEAGQPRLEIRLFGIARLQKISGGAMAAKGEIMRYLAEVAWAPDAILLNRSLTWETAGGGSFRVGAGMGGVRGSVVLTLDERGRIGSVFAPDRPRYEGGDFVERPWQGRFSDYREHQGRWLPFEGEVGWVLDETSFVAWKGRLQSWSVS